MYLLLSERSRQEASHLDNSRNVRLARDVGTRWPARAWTSVTFTCARLLHARVATSRPAWRIRPSETCQFFQLPSSSTIFSLFSQIRSFGKPLLTFRQLVFPNEECVLIKATCIYYDTIRSENYYSSCF